jgi:hypothetical protein
LLNTLRASHAASPRPALPCRGPRYLAAARAPLLPPALLCHSPLYLATPRAPLLPPALTRRIPRCLAAPRATALLRRGPRCLARSALPCCRMCQFTAARATTNQLRKPAEGGMWKACSIASKSTVSASRSFSAHSPAPSITDNQKLFESVNRQYPGIPKLSKICNTHALALTILISSCQRIIRIRHPCIAAQIRNLFLRGVLEER